ncbi:MAG: hypothetical protein J6A04_04505 [Clostridia bacterium]|nr:hypothetical protein [Clostridia bacterium]
MNKKYIVYIVIALIFVIGIASYIFFNNKKQSSVYLKIICGEETISSTYKENDKFECNILGNNFEIKIEDISNKKIELSSSTYGLFPRREDGSISLVDKVKNFELYKGEKLILALQATDVSADIVIVWE